jgi:anionic cell wall polymer biosynthesis LytR-Cps2A-Psr (LCP) family protein
VGETITMTGADAEKFVRARMNMEDDRNELRMARQEVYLNSFIQKFDGLSEEEILSVYDKMMDYVVTNMGSKTFADLTSVCKNYTKLDSIKIAGTSQIENGFETFRMDDVSRIETSLKLFYSASEE